MPLPGHSFIIVLCPRICAYQIFSSSFSHIHLYVTNIFANVFETISSCISDDGEGEFYSLNPDLPLLPPTLASILLSLCWCYAFHSHVNRIFTPLSLGTWTQRGHASCLRMSLFGVHALPPLPGGGGCDPSFLLPSTSHSSRRRFNCAACTGRQCIDSNRGWVTRTIHAKVASVGPSASPSGVPFSWRALSQFSVSYRCVQTCFYPTLSPSISVFRSLRNIQRFTWRRDIYGAVNSKWINYK